MSEQTALERLLQRDRAVTLVALGVLTALAWIYIVFGAGLGMSAWDMTTLTLFPHLQAATAPMPDMSSMPGMDMPGMDMGGMDMSNMAPAAPPTWAPATWALMIGMWWSMMIAMMSPSASPAILLYARTYRHAQTQTQATDKLAPTGVFAAGYLLVWLVFAVIAVGAHWVLVQAGLLSATMMGSQSRWLSAATLIAAGVYQLSPLRRRASRIADRRPRFSRSTGARTRAARCAWACCTAPIASVAAGF